MPTSPKNLISGTLAEQKAGWRRVIRERAQSLDPVTRERESAWICEELAKKEIWQNARTVLFFAARWDEVDLWPLLLRAVQEGRKVALPQYDAGLDAYHACLVRNPLTDVIIGHYHIREPREGCERITLNLLDLALVPGVAFSGNGCRLGRGKGYYDRLLTQVAGVKCGVGFDWQADVAVPVEAHDVRLNCLITPTSWREF